jgi:hypothetical protein
MTQPHVRPEVRRRSDNDSQHAQPWADTHPVCFRSEAFAEDLPEPEPRPAAARSAGPAWGLRRQVAALPMLGMGLAGILGVFAR